MKAKTQPKESTPQASTKEGIEEVLSTITPFLSVARTGISTNFVVVLFVELRVSVCLVVAFAGEIRMCLPGHSHYPVI